MCKEELTTGIRNPPYDFPWLLAEAFYHKPEQLKDEFVNQKLTYLNTYAVEGTDLSVSEIAYELGFEHLQSFSKLFKNKTNLSPLAFRQSFN